jgi:uncharacterized protein YjaG (DUF416 family)
LDQRILDGQELTPEERSISEEQLKVLKQTLDTLNQPVPKGDMGAAKARVNALKQQFESLSPDLKDYLYSVLQTDMGRKDLSEVFHGKLSAASRDELLKILNPSHTVDQIKKETINNAKEKTSKAVDIMLSGMSFEYKLKTFLEAFEEKQEK